MKRQTKALHDPRQLDLFGMAVPAPVDEDHAEPVPAPPSAPAPIALRPPAGTPGLRSIVLDGQYVQYALRRSKRRSIGFMIGDDGLLISAPRWVTIAGIEEAIQHKTRWILTKLHERRERAKQHAHAQSQWTDGGKLPYFGGVIVLRLGAHGRGVELMGEELQLDLPADADEASIKARVQGFFEQQAMRVFAERLPIYAAKLGVTYASFALSSATTQWGSCTSAGKIRLNWRLMHVSLPLIDYVIAHELAHIREMNHSARFWATVASVFPDYEAARRALQKRSREIMPLFS
ncbi:MAG TPA: SprT family zinc-dependent metalloprotease [Burkholderiaceae bacterium]